jgi:predicted metal-binding protein
MPSVPAEGTHAPYENRPTLYVCISCRREGTPEAPDGAKPEGRRLYDAVRGLVSELGPAAPVHAVPTICFANCESGCSAAIAAPGKWSYLMGRLGPEHAADLLTYAAAYTKAATGVVLPSGRPASLQHAVIARFPAHLDGAHLDAAHLYATHLDDAQLDQAKDAAE